MSNFKLRDHLRCKVVLPVALGMVACVLVAVIVLYKAIDPWQVQTTDAIQQMTLDASMTRIAKMSEHVNVVYNRLDNDLAVLRNTTYAALEVSQSVVQFPPTFYGATINGIRPMNPPQEDVLLFHSTRTNAGFEQYSAALFQGKSSLAEVMADPVVNQTALVDGVFRALFKTSRNGDMNLPSSYINMMIGFETSLYRRYPYPSATSGFPNAYSDGSASYCDPSIDPSFGGRVGYHPQCRPWYVQAKQAQSSQRSAWLSVPQKAPEIVVYSTPYIDSASKTVTISASTPLFDRTQPTTLPFVGVVNIDFNMSNIDQVVLTRKIGKHGYFFLMDATGNVISHPRFVDRSITTTIETLEPLLHPTLRSILSDPNNPSGRFASNQYRRVTFNDAHVFEITTQGVDGRAYYLDWTVNANTGYIVVAVIPDSDFRDTRSSVLGALKSSLDAGTAGVTVVLAALIVCLTYVTMRISDYYAGILEDATLILKQAKTPNLEEQLRVREPVCQELDLLFTQFQPMLVAVNFGNDSYYDDNMDKALRDYDVAEQLMQRMKNRKGLATVYNNKGNVFLKLNRFADAQAQYNSAIEIGRELIENCERDIESADQKIAHHETASVVVQVEPSGIANGVLLEKKRLQTTRIELLTSLAARLSNLAVLYKHQHRLADAYRILQEAQQTYESADNDKGVAQVASNWAQFMIEDNQLDRAQAVLFDTWGKLSATSDDRRPDAVSLQYVAQTLGILCQAQLKLMDATGWFQYTLQLQDTHHILDAQVQQTCFQRLQFLFEQLGNPEMARKYRVFRQRNLVLKDVLFSLDISGSMAGSKITRCRESINDVITNYVQPEDRIGLITFNNAPQTVFPLTFRGFEAQTLQTFRDAVNNRTSPNGQTALWDALYSAITQFSADKNPPPQSVQEGAASSRNQWVIALTDGEDNQSARTASSVQHQLQLHPVHLIIITVGNSYDRVGVSQLVDTAKRCHRQGHHIPIESDSIAKAFENVAKLITHQLIVEKL